jgi:transposase, IS6 family
VDGHRAYARAIFRIEAIRGTGPPLSLPTVTLFKQRHFEQDHRFIKKRIVASLGFRSAEGACGTIEGYEAMHLIRKGQIRWLAKGDVLGQRQFIHTLFGIAA